MAWDLEVGDEDARTAIQERHGGSLSRGISAPARGSGRRDIMLWWRPERGEAFGYADGWTPSGDAFYYSGLGQEGDQGFGAPYQENGRLRDHAMSRDHVRLLKYVAKNKVRYLGEFHLDPVEPWRWRDGPDRVGQIRKILQFRLLPVGYVLCDPSDPVHEPPLPRPVKVEIDAPVVAEPTKTEVEALNSAAFRQATIARELLVHRREAKLVHTMREWLRDQRGVVATGLRIPYAPESRNLRADLYVSEPPILIEAKSTSSREAIRLAIGQLFDYRRWMRPQPALAVLVPSEPPKDMVDLLTDLGIGSIWPTGGSFMVNPRNLL